MPYRVFMDDNFHYAEEDERYLEGEYESLEAAIIRCRHIVDEYLASEVRPGMTADELFARYRDFGPDPFIRFEEPGNKFSAWTYAEQRCRELCGEAGVS